MVIGDRSVSKSVCISSTFILIPLNFDEVIAPVFTIFKVIDTILETARCEDFEYCLLKRNCMLMFKTCGLLLTTILVFFAFSCSDVTDEKPVKIGFSQCTGQDNWRKKMLEGMQRELSFHPGASLIYKDAEDNSELQVKQIRELLQDDIDILIVSPNEAKPLTPIVEEAFNSGIPVIVVDRQISSDLYTSFVGANNYEVGKLAGSYVANFLKGKGNVVEIIGLPGSTPAMERHRGFSEELRKHKEIIITDQVYGNWMKNKAAAELRNISDRLKDVNLVFAHNDLMALGAYEVFKELGTEDKTHFIGVDGLPGPGGGIQFVSDKILDATLLYPTGGEEAIQTAFKILNKEPFLKQTTLHTLAIDSSNVRLMKLQTDKINSQQKDIERQTAILREQVKIYNNQRTLLNLSIAALTLIILLATIAFLSLRNNKKINKRLAHQNEEIIDQRNKLIEMSNKAKEATEAKFNFFTNISHEFRTPISLVLSQLENVLSMPRLAPSIKTSLDLANKNVMRLLRLVNQLMDFRKIEHNKMNLRATENDLPDFVSEIIGSFRDLADKKYISLNLTILNKNLKVWFDVNILDKVLFNLISNAYKFTNEHGFINITVGKSKDEQAAVIRIEDSGIGMSKETAEQAFDLFYQCSDTISRGYGIGLALSKELIQLHHGTIDLKSERWKGTSFEIKLPLGKAHLASHEMDTEDSGYSSSKEDIRLYVEDAASIHTQISDTEELKTYKASEHTILLIEDNKDLRNYIKSKLENEYEVQEAEDGATGLNITFDLLPDIIITDIILPGKDGLNITDVIKNDTRTSHIPVILLTGKVGMENQLEALKVKCDAFITKPFNMQYLQETIRNLLKNRASLREHYTSEIPVEIHSTSLKKDERKFISQFTSIVENNVSNENFSIEDIIREMGISRVQLYRKAKALLGYNINDYILNVRIQKAKYLLKENLTISEVAYKVGFSSQAYFSTVFKSRCSVTPTEFRDNGKIVNK
jgi:ABC-type sugar transport system substrate-binding protein/DNA-binding response OmpR family regulator